MVRRRDAHENSAQLLKLMPVPLAHERRFALRRRAVEMHGHARSPSRPMITRAVRPSPPSWSRSPSRPPGRQRRRAQRSRSGHAGRRSRATRPPGETLLEMTALPQTFSHSQLRTYSECPLQYAFQKRLPHSRRGNAGLLRVRPRHPPRVRGVTPGSAAMPLAAGQAPPGYEELKQRLRRGVAAAQLRRRPGCPALRLTRGAGSASLLRSRGRAGSPRQSISRRASRSSSTAARASAGADCTASSTASIAMPTGRSRSPTTRRVGRKPPGGRRCR